MLELKYKYMNKIVESENLLKDHNSYFRDICDKK